LMSSHTDAHIEALLGAMSDIRSKFKLQRPT